MRVIESRGRCLFFHRLARLSQKGDFTRIRHSREGGNPASVTSKRPSLDSRFRGNDDSFVADSFWRARPPKRGCAGHDRAVQRFPRAARFASPKIPSRAQGNKKPSFPRRRESRNDSFKANLPRSPA